MVIFCFIDFFVDDIIIYCNGEWYVIVKKILNYRFLFVYWYLVRVYNLVNVSSFIINKDI